jgi:hypothetical protein
MRALLITDWMSGAGGAERYIALLRDGLRAVGDEVKLLTSSAGSAGDGSADYRAYGTERLAAQPAGHQACRGTSNVCAASSRR